VWEIWDEAWGMSEGRLFWAPLPHRPSGNRTRLRRRLRAAYRYETRHDTRLPQTARLERRIPSAIRYGNLREWVQLGVTNDGWEA
jgi:hypothetical protein